MVDMMEMMSMLTMDDLCSIAKYRLNGKQLRELYFLIEQILNLFENCSEGGNYITLVPYEEDRKFSELVETLRLTQEKLKKMMAEKLINLDPRDYDRELANIKAEIIGKYAAKHSNSKVPTLESTNLDLINELKQAEVLFNELKRSDPGLPQH
ncbi:MAG: hypothetical protein LBI29_02365 [Rickettsiales bacterium]|jgi:hypothetical protein|nr:hypothetical protein [Rickettsiales bacterium]